jgi:hypothetical protein
MLSSRFSRVLAGQATAGNIAKTPITNSRFIMKMTSALTPCEWPISICHVTRHSLRECPRVFLKYNIFVTISQSSPVLEIIDVIFTNEIPRRSPPVTEHGASRSQR